MTTRVLVVDDEELVAYCVRRSLELGFPDCTVDVARCGEEALNAIAGKTHDLIITDYHMPGTIDGLALIGEARQRNEDVPIILMTGFGSAELRAKARALGVNHFMQKPLELDHLLAIAGEVLTPQ